MLTPFGLSLSAVSDSTVFDPEAQTRRELVDMSRSNAQTEGLSRKEGGDQPLRGLKRVVFPAVSPARVEACQPRKSHTTGIEPRGKGGLLVWQFLPFPLPIIVTFPLPGSRDMKKH